MNIMHTNSMSSNHRDKWHIVVQGWERTTDCWGGIGMDVTNQDNCLTTQQRNEGRNYDKRKGECCVTPKKDINIDFMFKQKME